MSRVAAEDRFDWRGPASEASRRSLLGYLKEAIIPPKGHRVMPTYSGMLVVFIGLCLGLAAYNTENNIIFAALALLLSAIILSGVVCWSNFQSARWRLETSPIYRVGEESEVSVVVENARRRFPMFCLRFDLDCPQCEARQSLYLKQGLEPGESARLVWRFKPEKRCRATMEVVDSVSSFPFGFLRKHIAGDCAREILVWPARVSYQRLSVGGASSTLQGQTTKARGEGGELIGLREYQRGDAPRSIHWKASAKQGRLVVKQNAAENQERYHIVVDPSRYLWADEAAFDRMCSLAATLAEDLFLAGKLDYCAIAGSRLEKISRVTDLEAFFDELAALEPSDASGSVEHRRKNNIVFSSLGNGAVGAFINGKKYAQA